MWDFFKHFFKPHEGTSVESKLYWHGVEVARTPWFYTHLKIEDTLDGRFDMVVLFTFCLIHHLQSSPQTRVLSEKIMALMMADFDRNLREMGVGDFGVGRKVRHMGEAVTGRFKAYEAALLKREQDSSLVKCPLEEALSRNVYRCTDATFEAPARALGHIVKEYLRQVKSHSPEELLTGHFTAKIREFA